MPMQPKPMAETFRPLFPSCRVFILARSAFVSSRLVWFNHTTLWRWCPGNRGKAVPKLCSQPPMGTGGNKSLSFRLDLSPCENPADDLLDGDFLNIDVGHRQLVQQGFANGNHAVALDLELNAARVVRHDFAVFTQMLTGTIGPTLTLNGDELGVGKAIHHVAEAAIKEDRAVIDDDDALAKLLDR